MALSRKDLLTTEDAPLCVGEVVIPSPAKSPACSQWQSQLSHSAAVTGLDDAFPEDQRGGGVGLIIDSDHQANQPTLFLPCFFSCVSYFTSYEIFVDLWLWINFCLLSPLFYSLFTDNLSHICKAFHWSDCILKQNQKTTKKSVPDLTLSSKLDIFYLYM